MESVRKQLLRVNEILVFIGFALSGSMLFFNVILESSLQSMDLNILLYMAIIALASILYYLFSVNSSFVLQIIEYVFLPLSACIVISFIKKEIKGEHIPEILQRKVLNFLIAIVCFIVIGVIVLIKIVFINQIFVGEQNYEILKIGIHGRIYRLAKFVFFIPLIFFIRSDWTLQIIFLMASIIELIIVYKEMNFAKSQVEIACLIGALNNLSGLFFLIPSFREHYSNYGIFEGSLVIIFLFFRSLFVDILEMKYLKILKESANKIEIIEVQKMILYECLNEILHRKRGNRKIEWSLHFEKEIKTLYLSLIWQEKDQIKTKLYEDQIEKEDDRNANQLRDINRHFSFNYENSLKENKLKHKIGIFLTKYEFNSTKSSKKLIFKELVSFELKKILNDNSNEWNPCIEYFLSEFSYFSKNNLLKTLVYYYRRISITDQTVFNKIKNKKIYQVLQFYEKFHNFHSHQDKNLIIFQELLVDLKSNLKRVCENEIKLIEKMAKPQKNMAIYQEKLNERYECKQKILKTIEILFQNEDYLRFEEFVYLYLLFRIIFCKSIKLTNDEVRERFLSPMFKNHHKFLKNTEERILMVCNGLKKENQELGQIILNNTAFKKQFRFYPDMNSKKRSNIFDLFSDISQAKAHEKIVQKFVTFNFENNQPKKHSDYSCFIRTQIGDSNYCFIQEYQIQVELFYGHPSQLYYICKFNVKNSTIYTTSEDLKKIEIERSHIRNILRETKFTVKKFQQLGFLMEIVQIPFEHLKSLKYHFREQKFKDKGSLQVLAATQNIQLNEQQLQKSHKQKFDIIENKIWNNSFKSQKMLQFITCTFLIFVLITGIYFFMLFLLDQKHQESFDVTSYSINLIQDTQNFEVNFAIDLTILRALNTSRYQDHLCEDYGIPSLKKQVEDNIQFEISTKLNSFFENSFKNSEIFSQILKIFKQRSYHFPDTHMLELKIDYLNYANSGKSMIKEYSILNFNTLKEPETEWIKYVVRESNLVGSIKQENSFSWKVAAQTYEILEKNEASLAQIFTLGIITMVIAMFFFVICFFKIYSEFIGYFYLLESMNQRFFYNRISQVKYILKEIKNQNEKRFKSCVLIDEGKVKISVNETNQSEEYTFNELEKISESEIDQAGFSLPYEKVEQSPFTRILYSNKLKFFLIIMLFLFLFVSCFVFSEENKISIEKSKQGFDVFEIGKADQEAFIGILSLLWMKYDKDEAYFSEEILNQRYDQLRNQILKSNFFENASLFFTEQKKNQLLYSSICHNIQNINGKNSSCQELGFGNKSFMEVYSELYQTQIQTWISEVNNSTGLSIQKKLCQSMSIFNEIMMPSYKKLSEVVIQEITSDENSQYLMLMCFVSVITISFIVLVLELCHVHRSLIKVVRFEVMTFDTPLDLYENENFRPHLNIIYNSTEMTKILTK